MALSKTITLKDQFEEDRVFPNAYFRVDRIEGSKKELYVYLACYKTKESLKPLSITTFVFNPSLLGDNFIAQSYNYIKSLSEFSDCLDC